MKVQINWTIEDVLTLFDISEEEAEAFLERNGKHIVNRSVEHGWEEIEWLGDAEGLPRVNGEDDRL